MQQIQKLTEQEMYEVYRQWFPEAFPKDEIRPWRSIRRQVRAGRYEGWGLYENGQLYSYAFFFHCEFVCRMRKGAPGSWKKRERPENGLKPGFLGRKRPGKSGKSADFTMRVRKQKTALLGPFFVFEWMRARLSKTAF